MSRFYVGQRVRIKWSDMFPSLAGKAGRIIAPDDGMGGTCAGWTESEQHWFVAPDEWGTLYTPLGGRYCPPESALEPATDSYDVVSWKDCVWQPEHLRAEA